MKCNFDVVQFVAKLRASGHNLTDETLRKFAADEAVLYYVEHQKEFAQFSKTEVQKQNLINALEEKILREATVHLKEEEKKKEE